MQTLLSASNVVTHDTAMLSPSFFTPQSWQDAMDIAEYIGADNSEAAAHFLHALEGACTQLAALPGMGSRLTFDAKALKGARMSRSRKV